MPSNYVLELTDVPAAPIEGSTPQFADNVHIVPHRAPIRWKIFFLPGSLTCEEVIYGKLRSAELCGGWSG